MPDNLKTFIPITKVNAERREVWGVLAEEAVDKSGEIMDYESSKPNFEAWANQFSKATDGKSLGNLRAMHGNIAAGKLVSLEADDAAKTINIGAKVVDDGEWAKVLEGVYTGFSVGGSYAKRWHDTALNAKRYTAIPAEASLVDNPCMYGAEFQVIKADGATELHKFIGGEDVPLAKILSDLQKAGARHSSADNALIQEIHDAGCALGATCGTVEKLAKSYDEEPEWVAYLSGCDIADTSAALGLIAGIASRLAGRNADAANKLSMAVGLLTEALTAQAASQNAAIAAAVVDAVTDEQIITDAGLERIAAAVMAKLAAGDDAPLNKLAANKADVLTKADGDVMRKSLDEVVAGFGALVDLTKTIATQMRSVGPIVRELPSMGGGAGNDPTIAVLDKLIAGEADMATRQALMNKRATLAIQSIHAGGGNPIR